MEGDAFMSATFHQRMKIVDFFRAKRLENDISIAALSRATGVSTRDLFEFESLEKPMPLDAIFCLTICLNIPPEEVLNLVFDSTPRPGSAGERSRLGAANTKD